ncbi:MAG: hypothetical protein Q7S92_03600 [Candidatus Diapherotrites archaeon]|nr:hypothetical protein [Candidatus Diapherotrites archaeon]
MPIGKLPKKLVQRLRKASKKIDTRLGKMKNIDHRQNDVDLRRRILNTNPSPENTTEWGRRIRAMNIQRNYPEFKSVVIKRTEVDTAKETIREVIRRTRKHNRTQEPTTYVLLEPKAYVIGERLIAMRKAVYPTLEEILEKNTKRGQKVLEEFKAANLKESSKFESVHRYAYAELAQAKKTIYRACEIESKDIMVLGYRNGKFILMPLIDF